MSLAPVQGRRSTLIVHDAAQIARTVVEHLAEQGATAVGWLPVETVSSTLGHWREPLAAECARLGLRFLHGQISKDLSDLEDVTLRLLHDGADALFAVPGSTPRLVRAILSTGRTMPEDVLLVSQAEGPIEEALQPAVSTLSLCAEASARATALASLRMLRSDWIGSVPMPFELIPRESSLR